MRMVPSTAPQRPLSPENLPSVPERINHHLHEGSLDPAGTLSECCATVPTVPFYCSRLLGDYGRKGGRLTRPFTTSSKSRYFPPTILSFARIELLVTSIVL